MTRSKNGYRLNLFLNESFTPNVRGRSPFKSKWPLKRGDLLDWPFIESVLDRNELTIYKIAHIAYKSRLVIMIH